MSAPRLSCRRYTDKTIGDKSQALDLLDRAYEEHDFSLIFLQVAPWFESLRGEARFEQLARKMQLPPSRN